MWTQEKVCIYKGFHTIHTDNTCCSVVCTCTHTHKKQDEIRVEKNENKPILYKYT